MIRIAVLLLAAVAALRLWLEHHGFPGDAWSAGQLGAPHFKSGAVADVTMFFTALGSAAVATVVLVFAYRLALRGWGRPAARLIVAAMGVVVVNAVLKLISGPTPAFVAAKPALAHASNFPSGHTAYATAFYGVLAYLAHRHGNRDATLGFALLVILMGVTRPLAGSHLVSDVVAGYLVGAAWLLVVLAIARRSGLERIDGRRCG